MRLIKLIVLAISGWLLLPIGSAFAVACAGPSQFTDIAQSSSYCTDAEWLKNRGVTIGCTSPTLFCPNDYVTRGSMALFMQRLGTALSPEMLRVDTVLLAIDLDAPPPIIACQTTDYAPAYPRRAFISTTFSGAAEGPLEYRHEIYVSTDGGVTWTFTNSNVNRNGTAGTHWVSSNTDYIQDLNVGTTYRWGVRLGREGAGDWNFSEGRCFINAQIMNRTGASSPFDSATPRMQPDR